MDLWESMVVHYLQRCCLLLPFNQKFSSVNFLSFCYTHVHTLFTLSLKPAVKLSGCRLVGLMLTLQGVSFPWWNRSRGARVTRPRLYSLAGRGAQEQRIMGSLTWTDISSCCRGENRPAETVHSPCQRWLYLQQAVPNSPSHAISQGHLLLPVLAAELLTLL